MRPMFMRLCAELCKQAGRRISAGMQGAAGWFGVAIVPQRQYKALVDTAAHAGRKTAPAAPKEKDAIETDQAYYLPPRVAFPVLPGIAAGALEVRIVDVGAQPLSYEEHIYAPLMREGDCRIVGFDPFADPGLEQPATKFPLATAVPDPRVTTLSYFIGNGEKAKFHLNAWSPTSSLFPSNLALMNEFSGLTATCNTVRVIDVETRKLDDVKEIDACDYLKVDVQGGDFDVVAHAARLLEKTLCVHIEAEFAPLYSGQPLFSDIDVCMRQRGFQLIDLVKFGWNNYKALPSHSLRSRLLWADAIYMKDPAAITAIDPRLLLRTAYIAHVVYRKYDLAAHLISLYDASSNSNLHNVYGSAIAAELNKA